jgi:putative transposase
VCCGVSERLVCGVLGMWRNTCRYQRVADEQAALWIRLRDLACSRAIHGYRRLHILLAGEGSVVNHKRVYRVYKNEGLMMRPKKPRRHFTACRRIERMAAKGPNECWNTDFMSDELCSGQRIRLSTLFDSSTRDNLAIGVDTHLVGHRVGAILERLR